MKLSKCRQLVQVQGSDYDLGMALSPELIAQSPYNFGFLNRHAPIKGVMLIVLRVNAM